MRREYNKARNKHCSTVGQLVADRIAERPAFWGELIEMCMSTGNTQLACCILTALQATDEESESEVSIGAEALAEVLQILLKYQLDEIEVVLNDSGNGIRLRHLRSVCAYIDEGSRLVRLVGKEIDSRIGNASKTQ